MNNRYFTPSSPLHIHTSRVAEQVIKRTSISGLLIQVAQIRAPGAFLHLVFDCFVWVAFISFFWMPMSFLIQMFQYSNSQMVGIQIPTVLKCLPAPARRNRGIEKTATDAYCWARVTSRPPKNSFRSLC